MHDFPYKSDGRFPASTRRAQFHDSDKYTIANCFRVAAERFDDHAKEFHKLAEMKPGAAGGLVPTGEGAKRLAEQFEYQAKEARRYGEVFENAHEILDILYEGDDE